MFLFLSLVFLFFCFSRFVLYAQMEGMLPAPKACALVVIKAKTTQSTSSVEVGVHLRPDEAIAGPWLRRNGAGGLARIAIEM